MELLVVLFFIYAVHSAVEDTKTALRKSRGAYVKSADLRFPKAGKSRRAAHAARHDAGFWAGQAAQGFPAARHGLAAGWLAGRKAQDEGRAAREAAKADHLETRAGLIAEVREHRRRQRAALEQIRAQRETGEGGREGTAEDIPQSLMAPPQHPAVTFGWPFGGVRQGEVVAHPGGELGEGSPAAPTAPDPGPERRICVACGNPEYGPRRSGGNWGPLVTYDEPMFPDDPPEPRLVHKAHFEDEATGFYGRPYQPAPAPDDASGQPGETSEGSGEGTAAPETEPPAPPTQGEPTVPAADTSYDQVLTNMSAAAGNAEVNAAQQQRESRFASTMSEEMQALEVDPATLGAMADHLDAQEAATKAQQRVHETAETVVATLKRGHAGLAEAHQNAPVEAAAKPFYAG